METKRTHKLSAPNAIVSPSSGALAAESPALCVIYAADSLSRRDSRQTCRLAAKSPVPGRRRRRRPANGPHLMGAGFAQTLAVLRALNGTN